MGTHATKSAISRRAYAKRRRVSEAAIRKRIADGTLAKALTKDGRIKPDVADRILATSTTAGENIPASLVEARRRKAAAGIALLQDEVDAMATGYLPKREIDETTRGVNVYVARHLFRLPALLAPLAAGKPVTVAGQLIDETVRQVLTEISEFRRASAASDGETAGIDKQVSARSQKLGDFTPVELATIRTDLLARRLELRRAIAKGELGHVDSWVREELGRIRITQRMCLSLPHKLAPFCERAKPARIAELVEHEVASILHHLACAAVSHAELVAAGREGLTA